MPTARHPFRPAIVTAAVVGLALLAAGCGSPGGGDPAAAARESIVRFLDAMKRGDEAAARGLLTSVARTKTDEMGVSVAPPVSETTSYAVGECEMVSQTGDLAHVATTWTDVDGEGAKTSENVVWVVRLDPEGWRVVGMAMRVFDDLPPLLLNFEDPEDMLAKNEMVAAELERRAAAAEAAEGSDRAAAAPSGTQGTLR